MLSVLLVALCLGASASPASAAATPPANSVGIRLVDGPASKADDPRARQYVVDHLQPGETIKRHVEVTNNAHTVQVVRLYAASASVRAGQFRFGEGRAANELTRWTTVSRLSVTLVPGAKRVVVVTIAVPVNTRPAERYAVVWAEVTAAHAAGGINAVNRVGIRVYLSVSKGDEPISDFVIRSMEARRDAAGHLSVEATVQNTGARALDLNGSLTLRDGPGGLSAGPFLATLGTTLAIGASGRVQIPIDDAVPAGRWQVRLEVRSGTVVHAVTTHMTFPSAKDSSSSPIIASASAGGPGWMAQAVIGSLLLVVLLLGVILFRRRRTGVQA